MRGRRVVGLTVRARPERSFRRIPRDAAQPCRSSLRLLIRLPCGCAGDGSARDEIGALIPSNDLVWVKRHLCSWLSGFAAFAGGGVATVTAASPDRLRGMHARAHPPRQQRGTSPARAPRAATGRAGRAPVVHRLRDGRRRRCARQRGAVHHAGSCRAPCGSRLRPRDMHRRAGHARSRRPPAQRQPGRHHAGASTTASGTSPARTAAPRLAQPITSPRPGPGPGPQAPRALGGHRPEVALASSPARPPASFIGGTHHAV